MYMTSIGGSTSLPEVYDVKFLKMVSGYDLLDKLSRRRLYAQSNVREKTSLCNLERENTVVDHEEIDIQVLGSGLMERTSIDPRRSRSMPWFEDSRATYQHHADYLKRLSRLRQDLLSQEETHLASALERLRIRQNARDNASPRFKGKEVPDMSPRKSLMTTIEQFQRMRPKKSPPRITMLEGKQILEPQSYRSSLTDNSPSVSSGSTRSFDEKIRVNLQRIIQPTSSIPNIGRKSNVQNRDLVLESSPLQRSKLPPKHRDEQFPERNPFKAVLKGNGGRTRRLLRPDSDELDLSPQAIKFENLSDKDKMNLEKLRSYYCIYYLPSNTPVPSEEDEYFENFDDESGSENGSFNLEKKKRISLLEGKSILPQVEQKQTHHSRKREMENRNSISWESKRNTRKTPRLPEPWTEQVSGKHLSPSNSKKHIVVDMPSIVFNSATPDKTETDDFENNTVLRKAYKQNEIRQRELKNLLEDVKELNLLSDRLTEKVHPVPD